MEGPTVVKLDDLYYLFYSANHFKNIDYAVGYATSTSPYGPWKKHANNPIIHRSIVHENGSDMGICLKVWTEDITMYIMFIIQIQLCSRVNTHCSVNLKKGK